MLNRRLSRLIRQHEGCCQQQDRILAALEAHASTAEAAQAAGADKPEGVPDPQPEPADDTQRRGSWPPPPPPPGPHMQRVRCPANLEGLVRQVNALPPRHHKGAASTLFDFAQESVREVLIQSTARGARGAVRIVTTERTR